MCLVTSGWYSKIPPWNGLNVQDLFDQEWEAGNPRATARKLSRDNDDVALV